VSLSLTDPVWLLKSCCNCGFDLDRKGMQGNQDATKQVVRRHWVFLRKSEKRSRFGRRDEPAESVRKKSSGGEGKRAESEREMGET
jgi:hypothetical protein